MKMKKLIFISFVLAAGFYFSTAKAASITDASPTSVVKGEGTITITGSGFGNSRIGPHGISNYVEFGYAGIATSDDYVSWSDTQIIVKVPKYVSPSSSKIKVVMMDSVEYGLDYRTHYGPVITYLDRPKIDSIKPSMAYPGSEITLYSGYSVDDYFGSSQGAVTINGQNATINSWSLTIVKAVIPNSITPGTANVILKNSSGTSSNSVSLTIKTPPSISGIDPTSIVPGVSVMTISGSAFGLSSDFVYGNSKLWLGDTQITSVQSWADSRITFTVPRTVTSAGQVFVQAGDSPKIAGPSYSIRTTDSSVTNDPLLKDQYYLSQTGVISAWNITKGSSSVVVAVVDDGIYVNHPDLKDHIWTNPREVVGNSRDDDNNGYSDDIYGYDFVSSTGEMTTRGSHGTQVAGIIGAVSNNSQGIVGINWNVKLMPLIACDNRIGCPTNAVVKAIKYAADNGASIINLSLGSSGVTTYSTDYDDAIRYAYNKGVVIVAAAGNGDVEGEIGYDLNKIPQSPVCNDNNQNMVLGVAAVNQEGTPLAWSNYGNCVDVVAPGNDIFSTSVPAYSGDWYAYDDGTSFSAPIVSGLAALLKAKYPSMPNYEIINRIKRNATLTSRYGRSYGSGLIDAHKTLSERYDSPPSTTPTPQPTPSANGNVRPEDFGLREGDVISASGSNDPDVYIVNQSGYKRLFLNVAIFKFYGHLGGFGKVKNVSSTVRDVFVTSGLFRNCETNDKKVYAVEVTGEDSGILHWVNVSGDQAVVQDPNFFQKIFCINNNEFRWYPKSSVSYTNLNQIPIYVR